MTEHVRQVAPVVGRPTSSADDTVTDTVLVVGAGSVGLTAAGKLVRQGARVSRSPGRGRACTSRPWSCS